MYKFKFFFLNILIILKRKISCIICIFKKQEYFELVCIPNYAHLLSRLLKKSRYLVIFIITNPITYYFYNRMLIKSLNNSRINQINFVRNKCFLISTILGEDRFVPTDLVAFNSIHLVLVWFKFCFILKILK